MQNFTITSLPRLHFAHVFRADSYKSTTPPRTGLLEVTYISKGCLRTQKNGREYCARAGDITCDLFESEQTFLAEAPHEHHTVGFFVDISPDENGLAIPYLTEDFGALSGVRERIDEIIRTAPEDGMRCAGLFLLLLAELDDYHKKQRAGAAASPHAMRAKQYVAAHLHEPISEADAAAELGISPEYLCAVFKKSEGETFIRYANRRKLATIAAIMQNENIPLSQAAAMYGFSDPNYVSRLYRRYFGRTLTESLGKKLRVFEDPANPDGNSDDLS